MSDKSAIQWTDATWNPIVGCSRVSEGCRNCYAEVMAARIANSAQARLRDGGTPTPAQAAYRSVVRWRLGGDAPNSPEDVAEPRWNGRTSVANGATLTIPLRWKRPRRIFVDSEGDLFHETVTDETIAAVFGIMAAARQHTFQVLTKRPERAEKWFRWAGSPGGSQPGWVLESAGAWVVNGMAGGYDPMMPSDKLCRWRDEHEARTSWPLPNVWLGVSVEDQATADARIPALLRCPAAVRWISAEPLLGSVDVEESLGSVTGDCGCSSCEEGHACERGRATIPGIDWAVAGGESGHGARPMHPDWARALRNQCAGAGVPFHFKQWGEWCPRTPGEFPIDDSKPRVRLSACGCDGQTAEPVTPHRTTEACGGGDVWMGRVGKKAAGRVLDGRTWDEWPA